MIATLIIDVLVGTVFVEDVGKFGNKTQQATGSTIEGASELWLIGFLDKLFN